jgi:Cu(I)/Ag(I) efflux system protein CusF
MNTPIQRIAIAGAFAFYSISSATLAHARQDTTSHAHHESTNMAAQAAMSEGEIQKVDRPAGKLTIKHGELKNLGMPGMTMAFKLADPAMAEQVKQGDKVHFVVEKVAGSLTVTAIEVIN